MKTQFLEQNKRLKLWEQCGTTGTMMPIKGYESYQITRDGRIFSKKGEKSLCLDRKGYQRVFLSMKGVRKKIFVHVCVALTFLKKPNDGKKYEVNHKNKIRSDNRVENLEWVSSSDQKRHARTVGTFNSFLIPVKKFDLFGEFLQEYPSAAAAAKGTGLIASNIIRTCKGKTKTCGGFQWEYSNQEHERIKEVNTKGWKKIPGFERYLISRKGQIYSTRQKILLKIAKTEKEYPCITIYNKGKNSTRNVHRLVALAWLPNPKNLPDVNHKDGNRQNYHVSNLEWVSKKENMRHAIGKGLCPGHKPRKVKRTNNETKKIKYYKSMSDAAKDSGCSPGTVKNSCEDGRPVNGLYTFSYV